MEYTKANGQDVQRSFFLSFRFLFVFFLRRTNRISNMKKIAEKHEEAFPSPSFTYLLAKLFSTRIIRREYAFFSPSSSWNKKFPLLTRFLRSEGNMFVERFVSVRRRISLLFPRKSILGYIAIRRWRNAKEKFCGKAWPTRRREPLLPEILLLRPRVDFIVYRSS